MTRFFLGTSGLVLPQPNKLSFPAEFRDKSRLAYYASLFNSIEVNSSFYKVPMAKTVARWAQSVPDNFQFTFKLWKGITHNKGLVFAPSDIDRFMDIIHHAGDKKGCLLVQFPASIQATSLQALQDMLEHIRARDEHCIWKLSVEFRHHSWYTEEINTWLHDRNISVVAHDIAAVPPNTDAANDWIYFRFHGPEKGYKGSYSADYLDKRAAEITALIKQGKTVYAYFNNTLGAPIDNLNTLHALVAKALNVE